MIIPDFLARLAPTVQVLARPYSVYVVSTAMAVALLKCPTEGMMWVGFAVVTGQAAARTCDKIWGRPPSSQQGDLP